MARQAKVLVTDHPWPGLEIEREILAAVGAEVVDAPAEDEETLASLAGEVSAIATCWAKVTARVIGAARQCRVVARMGIGLDNIDIQAATDRGMLVTNVPDYCVEEVAEHTIALLLALARRVGWFHLETKQGRYDLAAAPPMHRLSGQTLGLFGLGRIGRATAMRAQGLGLKVIAHTSSGRDYGTGVEMVSWERLVAESDFLSLHAPLTDETQKVLNADALKRMKPGACVINTSRGGLIDEAALWSALESGRLGGAGLDVFDPEPPDLSQPLFRDPRVIVTPHAAFVSEESLIDLRTRVARQIAAVLQGETPENVVNP